MQKIDENGKSTILDYEIERNIKKENPSVNTEEQISFVLSCYHKFATEGENIVTGKKPPK